MAQLHVELVAVEDKVWSGDASMVIARTTEGEIGILPGHTALLGQLADPATVRIKTDGGERAYTVHGGFVSISEGLVSILAETADPADAQAH